MEDTVKEFLPNNFISGYGYGYGSGSGSGYGFGSGSGSGYGYGCGDGYGDGSGYGYGDGSGYGYGYGSGSGSGSGYGCGDGDGCGYGYGDSSGYGDGCGDGDCRGIKSVNGEVVYQIDNTPTILTQIHGNIARGKILKTDLTPESCFVVKGNGYFAHGNTLHDAHAALQEKIMEDTPEEERIAAFCKQFPGLDTPYHAKDLFSWHHILTGSCRLGRETFCRNHGIDVDNGLYTIRQFIALTQNDYGGNIIKELAKQYTTL